MESVSKNPAGSMKQFLIIVTTSLVTFLVMSYLNDAGDVERSTAENQSNTNELASESSVSSGKELNGDIKRLELALQVANQQIQDLEGLLTVSDGELVKLGDEFLISYGTVEDLGLQMGSLVKKYMVALQRMKAMKEEGRSWKDMSKEEQAEGKMFMMGVFGEWTRLSPTFTEIKSLAETPEDAAKLQTVFLSEVFDLDEATKNAVGGIYDAAYFTASENGLAQSQMPDKDVEAWQERREEMSEDVSSSLSQYFSSDQMDVIKAMGNGNLLNLPDLSLQNEAARKSLGSWR